MSVHGQFHKHTSHFVALLSITNRGKWKPTKALNYHNLTIKITDAYPELPGWKFSLVVTSYQWDLDFFCNLHLNCKIANGSKNNRRVIFKSFPINQGTETDLMCWEVTG